MATATDMVVEMKKDYMMFANDQQKVDRMFQLKYRWLDEYQYEDFNDYIAEMKKIIPSHWKFIKGTKKPFGFIVTIYDIKIHIFTTPRGTIGGKIRKD